MTNCGSLETDKTQAAVRGLADVAAPQPLKLPPVHSWFPDNARQIDMHIQSDGTWLYEDGPIRREAMVRLFASILRREKDGGYFLVTPVEKCQISVADAPLIAVDLGISGSGSQQELTLITNTGDVVPVSGANPIRFDVEPGTGGFKPYVFVRHGLEALVSRPVAHELVDLAVEHEIDGETWTGIWSSCCFWNMGLTREIDP